MENLEQYYHIFFDVVKDEMANLKKAIKGLDSSVIGKITHKLKSGAYIIKEDQLIEILFNMENYAEKNDKFQLEKEFLRLKNILSIIEERVRNENSHCRR